MNEKHRTLTDEDVTAIVAELQKSLKTAFYNDIGRGVFGFIKGLMWIGALALAAYGASKGIQKE